MSDRDEELREFEAIVAGLIGRLEAGERSRLLRKMAHALRASQAKRMRAQQTPEGMAWAPRKNTARARKANRPIRFLYKKPGAEEPRVADLKSWRRDGPHIVGYDRERGALHSPEFTMVEWYRAGEPYDVLMEDCAAFLRLAATRECLARHLRHEET